MDDERLTEYWQNLISNVQSQAENDERYAKNVFLEQYKDLLIEGKFFNDINENFYETDVGNRTYKSMRIDAGYVEPSDNSIHLMAIDYDRNEMSYITNEKANRSFERLINFLYNVKQDYFRINNLQSHQIFEFVKEIIYTLPRCDNIYLYLLSTNRKSKVLKPNSMPPFEIETKSIPVTCKVLDISYLYTNEIAAQPNEPIEIDVTQYVPDGIEVLRPRIQANSYKAYLGVVPGAFLAQIYKEFGGRLLESNVRSFLSTRGAVNKGIRVTIRENPQLFFTYNNGIACTADDAVIEQGQNGSFYLKKLSNFQIINGGQTTASLRNSQINDKAHLKDIYVPMKLTIIDPKIDEVARVEMVHNISKYSNTQNKITSSDMNSNSPFYTKLEQISRRTMAPLVGNSTFQTYWFFERSRGQYEREQMELTRAQRKKFVDIHPKKQRMRIVDIAKYWNTAELYPYDVAWGGQVNAERFQQRIEDFWDKHKDEVNDLFFKRLVGKAILFNRVRELTAGTDWYKAHSGILAELTTYIMAKFVYEIQKLGKEINWLELWNMQNTPECFDEEILKLGEFVYKVMSGPEKEKDNFGEWAKLPKCWLLVKDKPYSLSDDVKEKLISKNEAAAESLSAKKDEKRNVAVEDAVAIFKCGIPFWEKVISEGMRDGALSGGEIGDLQSAIQSCQKGYMLPSFVAKRIMAIHKKLEDRGLDVRNENIIH